MMLPQMSYSFSMVHSTLYTFIGIQTLVIATLFPIIYWNCACLIVNSQSIEEDLLDEETLLTYESNDSDCTDNDDEETEDEEIENSKKKKRLEIVHLHKRNTKSMEKMLRKYGIIK